MRRVLILGGTRFFGKLLTRALLNAGDKVTLATRMRHPDDFGTAVERLKVDRSETESLASATKNRTWDLVYDQTCFSARDAHDAIRSLSGRIGHYVLTSSASVYHCGALPKREEDFAPREFPVLREIPADYAEGKRAAESVLFREAAFLVTAVRIPVVLGPNDPTGRVERHFEKAKADRPIGVRNLSARLGFISAKEAAEFLAWAGKERFAGPLNAASHGHLTVEDLLRQIWETVGKTPEIMIDSPGEGMSPFAWPDSLVLDTTRASRLGFPFQELDAWLPQWLAACATVSMATETTPRP